MKSIKKMFLGCYLIATSASTFAQVLEGISFSHQRWEIYCSNTGTCRAAGYQNDHDNNPASLLLTRKAGSKQPVIVEFALSDQEHSMPADKLKHIHFYVNGKDLGEVATKIPEAPLIEGKLSKQQANALLQQFKQKTLIMFKNAHYQWNISDAGMTAVLLKMDDFQKRVGTVGALVKKGNADESRILAAQPKLVVHHVKTASKPYLTLHPKSKKYEDVCRILRTHPLDQEDDSFCHDVSNRADYEDDGQPQTIELYKLSKKKVLAKAFCWRGFSNGGCGIWVLDDSLTGTALFITDSATDIESGIIRNEQAAIVGGYCWSIIEWVWNGEEFVQTRDMWTGMDKHLNAGGVWDLERIEALVK